MGRTCWALAPLIGLNAVRRSCRFGHKAPCRVESGRRHQQNQQLATENQALDLSANLFSTGANWHSNPDLHLAVGRRSSGKLFRPCGYRLNLNFRGPAASRAGIELILPGGATRLHPRLHCTSGSERPHKLCPISAGRRFFQDQRQT